jgi:lipoate-protein ligase A
MPSQHNADRYISIARACLTAINDTATDSGSREDKIQAVYEAIDDAFQSEFAEQRQAIDVMASVLERIASGELGNEDAATLARITLDQNPSAASQGRMH